MIIYSWAIEKTGTSRDFLDKSVSKSFEKELTKDHEVQ